MKVETQERIDAIVKEHTKDFYSSVVLATRKIKELRDEVGLDDDRAQALTTNLVAMMSITFSRSLHSLTYDYDSLGAMKKGLEFMQSYKSSPLVTAKILHTPDEIKKVVEDNPRLIENLLACTIRDREAADDTHSD